MSEERSSTTVVTSENLAEFAAKKLGLDSAPVEAAPAEPTEVSETTTVDPVDEAKPAEERKQNPKIERRFSEITKQREAAKQEAERERQARLELENKVRELEGKLSPPAPQEPTEADPKPKPEQFSDMFEYAEALAEWTADKKIQEQKVKEAAQKAEQERQKLLDTWSTRVQDFRAKTPDFDDMVASSDVVVNDDIRDAILESDVGPKILYHLAENEELAKKIAGMSERAALKEIGKLEARFEKTEPEVKPVKKSNAPAPVTPLKAVSGVADVKLDTDGKWYGSYAEWKAARKAGKVR